ncbi:hypothetical protein M0802_009825 [Mischocyttarus mexicanus]|nr:hypothetical protein M0802_009825 [Mischocyttarus mexicanus]
MRGGEDGWDQMLNVKQFMRRVLCHGGLKFATLMREPRDSSSSSDGSQLVDEYVITHESVRKAYRKFEVGKKDPILKLEVNCNGITLIYNDSKEQLDHLHGEQHPLLVLLTLASRVHSMEVRET